jgi:hypothetical protein
MSFFALVLWGSLPRHASAQDGKAEPWRAFFSRGNAYYCTKEYSLAVTDLQEQRHPPPLLATDQLGRPRWYVGQGYIWPTFFDYLVYRFDLGEFTKGKLLTVRGEDPKDAPHYLKAQPGRDPWLLDSKFERRAYFDVVPAASNRLRTLVLTNVRGRMVPITAEREPGLVLKAYTPQQTEEEKDLPYWAVNVYECRKDWNPRRRVWESDYEWKLVETIVPASTFREHFQVIAQGNDYYFVTSE